MRLELRSFSRSPVYKLIELQVITMLKLLFPQNAGSLLKDGAQQCRIGRDQPREPVQRMGEHLKGAPDNRASLIWPAKQQAVHLRSASHLVKHY